MQVSRGARPGGLRPRTLVLVGGFTMLIGFGFFAAGSNSRTDCVDWDDVGACDAVGQGQITFGVVLLSAGFVIAVSGLLASAIRSSSNVVNPLPTSGASETVRLADRGEGHGEQSAENVVTHISKLAELRDSGAITQEEFLQLKAGILGN